MVSATLTASGSGFPFVLSLPQAPDIRKHHDYINPADFPETWKSMEITVEVEAKAKELAVMRLMKALR